METPDFTIKRSDVGKAMTGQFFDGRRPAQAIDCSGNSARAFWLREFFTGALVISGADFSFTNAATGKFSYTFTAPNLTAMTPSPRGDAWFKAEFKVTLPGAVVMTSPTHPDRPYLIVKLEDDLSS